jgi:Xaa-Pro aminopeptidase
LKNKTVALALLSSLLLFLLSFSGQVAAERDVDPASLTVPRHEAATIAEEATGPGSLTPNGNDYQARRQAVRDAMEPDSVLVVRGLGPDAGQGRPDPNLYYLTGMEEARGGALVLYSSRQTGEAPPRRPAEVIFQRVSPDEATPSLRPSSEFDAFFERLLLSNPSVLYIDHRRSSSVTSPMTADEQLLRAARDRGAEFAVKPALSLVAPLRRIKSAEEIRRLRIATDITVAAHKEAMRAATPGMYEYQLQGIIEHVYLMNGSMRPGFSSIVGSGENSVILHWSRNNRRTEAGDVIVIDIGADYMGYTADVTRTIPVSGSFTPRQRQIYELVLKASEESIAMLAPGVNMRDVTERINEVLAEGLVALGHIKDRSELRKYATHGYAHSVGLQVHDVGGLGVLDAGMVITIEPGLYFPDEKLGVRIEDTILITEKGHENLSVGAPKNVADVEALMKEKGIDPTRYIVTK